MKVNVTIPSVGESISEGTIARWLKQEGEQVAEGEPLYELETDKATTEVPAPGAGVLHIGTAEGQTVAVGAVIGTIDGDVTPETKKQGKQGSSAPVPKKEPKEKAAPREVKKAGASVPTPTARAPAAPEPIDHAADAAVAEAPSPPVPHAETPPSLAAPDETPREEHDVERREPMSPIRLRIAQRMLESQKNAAALTTFNEADLSELEKLRARCRQSFQEKHGVKLGITSFFVKACTLALEALPIVNARIEGRDIVYPRHCNVGVAVSTERGLFVPVLRGAENMTIAQIELAIAALAEKARTERIGVHDLQDGTFTITNGGVFGSLLSTPLLNPPQSAILGLHAIQRRPVALDDQVVVRPMMYLALTYDHRLIDGRDAVGFLKHVKHVVENPASMLLEI